MFRRWIDCAHAAHSLIRARGQRDSVAVVRMTIRTGLYFGGRATSELRVIESEKRPPVVEHATAEGEEISAAAHRDPQSGAHRQPRPSRWMLYRPTMPNPEPALRKAERQVLFHASRTHQAFQGGTEPGPRVISRHCNRCRPPAAIAQVNRRLQARRSGRPSGHAFGIASGIGPRRMITTVRWGSGQPREHPARPLQSEQS